MSEKVKMDKYTTKKKKQKSVYLLDLVFSWSIKDVLNKNLFKNQVQQIPDNNFSSTAHYLNSFKMPLIEETRAEYCSGLESIAQAPMCEILNIWKAEKHKPPKNLLYDVTTKPITDAQNNGTYYEPESGDLFVLTTLRPKCLGDLIRPYKSLHFAFVTKSEEDEKPLIEILSSEKIDIHLLKEKQGRLFVTYLMNLTTNLRIWKALHPDPKSPNMGLIQNVLQSNTSVDDECKLCISKENYGNEGSKVSDLIGSFGLDASQREAILRSNSLRECLHKMHTVKLIWGPPGTGKTKTVASFLFVQYKLKCRTITCAPTNIAVVQVAERLLRIVMESLPCGTYGLGDIVLFGNKKRMKICDYKDLEVIFLTARTKIIGECLLPLTGWTKSLESMISLLEDPYDQYNTYLTSDKDKGGDSNTSDKENETSNADDLSDLRNKSTRKWTSIINQSLKENTEKGKRNSQHPEKGGRNGNDHESNRENSMTFEEFVGKNFCTLAHRLVFCAQNFLTHLPTSCLPLDVAKQMIQLVDHLLKTVEYERKQNKCQLAELIMMKREEILGTLKFLYGEFPRPKIIGKVKDFCLNNARLVFCTASGSIKLKAPAEMVVIDEAAQLKECESAIPLQIPGIKVALLIGDDRQLPAMVQSKVLERTNFGRSLFQRLVTLGKEKHLLNIQYRMHPSISSFPNKEFYENKIVDGPNVKESGHIKKFLKGDMFGSYSFINVSGGTENFKSGHSPRNFEEAAVVDHIIEKLFKEHYCTTKQKLSVGVISPYKGQVGLLQEKLGKKYTSHKDKFCINIRSVDGFQGGEEDIIIISTVRSNGNGSIGFLSNCQRTNVAITRARYCLWIVGNGTTLGNSESVWKNLVIDAKTRGCFYDADDHSYLNKSVFGCKSKFFEYLKLEKARWKVIFSNEFKNSISNTKSVITQIRVTELLHKIADGWRLPKSDKPLNEGVAFELIEQYEVEKNLNLVWTVDVIKENSDHIQVIKIWDVLPESSISTLAKNLSAIFGKYTVDFMNRCKHKSYEGDLVVPMSWPVPSFHRTTRTRDAAGDRLFDQFAAMNIGDDLGESSSSVRKNRKFRTRSGMRTRFRKLEET